MAFQDYYDTVQKLYIAFYQRPADPAGLRFWSQMLDAQGGNLEGVIDAFASSAEAVSLYDTNSDGVLDGSDDMGSLVEAIYQALFDRAPDAAGRQFYVDALTKGQFPDGRPATPGRVALDILNGAQGGDAVAIQNKLEVANLFTRTLDPDMDGLRPYQATYEGDSDAAAARDFLKTVTADPGSVKTAADVLSFIQNNIADSSDPILGQQTGQTFTLTTGVDVLTGTDGNDTFVADDTTGDGAQLNAGDQLDGGAGTDTLKYYNGDSAATTGLTVTLPVGTQNIEILDATNTGAAGKGMTFNVGGATGLTTVKVTNLDSTDSTTVNTGTADSVTDVSVTGGAGVTVQKDAANNSAAVSNVTVDGAAGAIAINSDALTNLTLKNLSNDAADTKVTAAAGTRTLNVTLDNVQLATGTSIIVQDDEATSIVVNTTGTASDGVAIVSTTAGAGASDITINANADLTNLDINADNATSLTITGDSKVSTVSSITDISALTSITVSGSAGLTADVSGTTTITSIDLSGTSGDNSLTVNVSVAGLSVKGGSGADVITSKAMTALAADAVINLNDGDDKFVATAAPTAGAKVDGGNGNDILGVTASNQLAANVYTGFEVLDIGGTDVDGGVTYDLSTLPGLKDILLSSALRDSDTTSTDDTATVSNVGADATLTFKTGTASTDETFSDDGISIGNVVVSLADTTGTSDVFNIVLDAVDGDNDGTAAGQAAAGVTVNGVETINITSNASVVDADDPTTVADEALTTADYTNTISSLEADAATTLNLKGDAVLDVTLGATSTAVNRIDATENTAGVVVVATGASATTFTGTAKADTYTASGNGDLIQANGGNDDITLAAGIDTVRYAADNDAVLSITDANSDGTMDTISIESITGFTSGIDKIELSAALGLATGDARTAITDKGVFTPGIDNLYNFIGDGVDFFNDGTTDRAVAFTNDGTDGYVFVDANADGNFTYADDIAIKLAGTTSISISDITFG